MPACINFTTEYEQYRLFIHSTLHVLGNVFNLQCCYLTTGTILLHAFFAAYGGEFCEEDRNGCSEIQCFEGVECLDVPAPGVGAMCGDCPDGYTGDGEKCFGKDLTSCFVLVNCIY